MELSNKEKELLLKLKQQIADGGYTDEDRLEKVLTHLSNLENKYNNTQQDLVSHLAGMELWKGVKYWDYIKVDTLMSLQQPRTGLPDEFIFIGYHQITELYFRLIIWELDLLTDPERKEYEDIENWLKRVNRISYYFKNLCMSFGTMVHGMDPEEFKEFRMALLPASGFQSAQYRQIEMRCTQLGNLVDASERKALANANTDEQYEKLYWKKGGQIKSKGIKSATLLEFEAKYDEEFKELIKEFERRNLNSLFQTLPADVKQNEKLKKLLRNFDLYANQYWVMAHYAGAAFYISKLQGTGGTNWEEYLPAKIQQIIFFPSLWSDEEKAEWGQGQFRKDFTEQIAAYWKI